MAHQLNASCNFNSGYLICDIPNNTVKVVVKIKTMFGNHILVKDQEWRMVKYRTWGKWNQSKVKIDTKKRVPPLKIIKVRREAMESITSSSSGTWISEGEGFGYLPMCFVDPEYPRTRKGEEEQQQKGGCTKGINDGSGHPSEL